MPLTKEDISLIKIAIRRSISDIHNEIGHCPDVIKYREEILKLEKKQKQLLELLNKFEQLETKGENK